MKSLVGNSILLVDNDQPFVEKLKKSLNDKGASTFGVCFIEDAKTILLNRDIEFVICSYYLADGLIHQLIDWCKETLDDLPLFVSLGIPSHTDIDIQHRHLIADAWEKIDSIDKLVEIISKHAFNEGQFKEVILGLVENRGIKIELISDRQKIMAMPQELVKDGLFVTTEIPYPVNTCAILRLSVYEGDQYINFSVLGFFREIQSTGQKFCVFGGYLKTWDKVLNLIEKRQLRTTKFLKKASGY